MLLGDAGLFSLKHAHEGQFHWLQCEESAKQLLTSQHLLGHLATPSNIKANTITAIFGSMLVHCCIVWPGLKSRFVLSFLDSERNFDFPDSNLPRWMEKYSQHIWPLTNGTLVCQSKYWTKSMIDWLIDYLIDCLIERLMSTCDLWLSYDWLNATSLLFCWFSAYLYDGTILWVNSIINTFKM